MNRGDLGVRIPVHSDATFHQITLALATIVSIITDTAKLHSETADITTDAYTLASSSSSSSSYFIYKYTVRDNCQ